MVSCQVSSPCPIQRPQPEFYDVTEEIKNKMVALTAKMEELYHNQTVGPSLTVQEEEEDDTTGPGNLMAITESNQVSLEAAFSTTLANTDQKSRWSV